ncbi:MAG: hypothetical protein N3A38_00540 [Planctomycetota bacterium]|nr:hypothetical protein [Planctomycetota bacterium]
MTCDRNAPVGFLMQGLGAIMPVFLAAASARAAEPTDYEKTLPEAERQQRQQVREEQKRILEEFKKKLQDENAKLQEVKSMEVAIDEDKLTVKEPATPEEAIGRSRIRDIFEIAPEDFDILTHDRWSLHMHDFKCDNFVLVDENLAPAPGRTWLALSFTITNSTDKPRAICPKFTLMTNKGAIRHHMGGFVPTRILSESVLKDLESPVDMFAFFRKEGDRLVPRQHFEPGAVRHGACVFPVEDQEFFMFNEAQLLVDGLNNAYKYDRKLKRTLVLTFEREGAEFFPHRVGFKYRGKRWEWVWMWDQDITVSLDGIMDRKLKTPNERDKFLWAARWEQSNSTGVPQAIKVKEVRMLLPMKVDVGGTQVEINAEVVDDGKSTIHKAAYMKDAGMDFKTDRLLAATIKPGDRISGTAIFDGADVDFDKAFDDIETLLTLRLDRDGEAKSKAEKVKPMDPEKKVSLPFNLYTARRVLTAEEREAVRTQVLAQVEPAVQGLKARKAVTLSFKAESGLATGERTIKRYYRKPGKIEEDWLKAWEELGREQKE